MSKEGFSPIEFLASLEDLELVYRELGRLKQEDLQEYNLLLDQLKHVNSKAVKGKSKQQSTTKKGQALEAIVTFLFKQTQLFEVYQNIRNTTNEIDQLVALTFKGKYFEKFMPIKGDMFLSECKNYNKKIDVTWVGKFYSLLVSNNAQYGFLFSYHCLTGTNWNDATGLTKKLFLLKERTEEKIYIINLNLQDFELIGKGYSILELFDAKIKELRTSTNFEVYLNEKHPAME